MIRIIPIIFLFCLSCKINNKIMQTTSKNQTVFVPVFASGQPVIVYKTKANYNTLVPVILSDDRTKIISYPHPSDLKTGSNFPLPVILNNGYLLDKRGIGKNVAFLKITYEEYSKLVNTPNINELYNLIIDKNPLTELCDCGSKTAFTDQITQLNSLIDKKILRKLCKVVK